jgi:hypothetical protein
MWHAADSPGIAASLWQGKSPARCARCPLFQRRRAALTPPPPKTPLPARVTLKVLGAQLIVSPADQTVPKQQATALQLAAGADAEQPIPLAGIEG